MPPARSARSAASSDALAPASRAKRRSTNFLAFRGRHFHRAIYAFGTIKDILDRAELLHKKMEADRTTADQFDWGDRHLLVIREWVHSDAELMGSLYALEESNADDFEVKFAARCEEFSAEGKSARSDDIARLKTSVIQFITPKEGLTPALPPRDKSTRGFSHNATGELLCPAGRDWADPSTREKLRLGVIRLKGLQWPLFLYKDQKYDPKHPWSGLLRSEILRKSYLAVFRSPSSAECSDTATRAGNAQLHNMTEVTPASLAYIAMLVRHSLSTASTFRTNDTTMEHHVFYASLLESLCDPSRQKELNELLQWWNMQIFPQFLGIKLPDHVADEEDANSPYQQLTSQAQALGSPLAAHRSEPE